MRISDWSSDVGSSDLQIGGIDLAGHVIIERQLHEAPRVARHRRFAQLQRIHFTETLETRDLRLGAAAFSDQAIEDHILLGFVEGVERSEERGVGKESVSRCRTWWWR